MSRLLFLATALLLPACAAPQANIPSLAPRAAEAIDPRLPVDREVIPGPAEPALAARLTELVRLARNGDGAFASAAAEAERLAGAAGGPQSESWVVAQQALSVAVAARAQTTRAMGDIDEIAATRIAGQRGIAPGNLAAISAAAAEVAAIDRRQAERIDRIQARLGS